jgi:Gluconate 2-dehydrogenase subunit 3
MGDKIELPVIDGAKGQGLGRRQILQGLLGGVGAGLVIPGLADAHPIHDHLMDAAKVAAADAKASAPGAKPEFLDQQQFDTLASLAEQIVPGSTKANVAGFVDQLLAVDTRESQRSFLNALGVFEGESIARYGHPWKALTGPQQVELLTAASTAQSSREPRHGRGEAPPSSGAPTLRDRFDDLKGWIAGAYYSSEIGQRELGYTGNMFFASFPGCQHPDGHN